MKDSISGTGNPTASISVERLGPIGFLVLSQPATLNALTLYMVDALHAGLQDLEADSDIALIVIRSSSDRAFCAGGDMKRIRQYCIDENFDAVEHYFTHEYALNLAIANCSKPYLALIDGIAMGGGLGVSIHGRFRVVTEKAVLAMPETRIGFFPDVGASYFLPRLPSRCGYWLGLTSASVKGSQAVAVGLATHHVASEDADALLLTLQTALQEESARSNTEAVVERCLRQYAGASQNESDDNFRKVIDTRAQWFADDDLDAIRQRLQTAATDDAIQLLTLLDSASPHSLQITCDLFRQAHGQDLATCLKLEYAAAQSACRHPDLVEGVRAVLIDKDRNPSWL